MVFKKQGKEQSKDSDNVSKFSQISNKVGYLLKSVTPRQMSKLIIATAALVALVLFGAFGYSQYKTTQVNKEANRCSSNLALLEEFHESIGNGSVVNNDNRLSKIQSLTDSGTDQNCLYVLTSYYVAIGDTDSAETYYNKFTRLGEPELYPPLKENLAEKPSQYLRKKIDFAKKFKEQSESNFRGTGYNTEESQ